MEVIKNNFEKREEKKMVENYPKLHICEYCNSELKYDKEDLRVGELGLVFLHCPCCKNDNLIEDSELTVNLTKDNIEFPVHFHHCSVETGAVDVCNNERVKEAINKAIDFFRKNKNESNWMTATGNLYVVVFKYDGDECYEVVVTNDYYDTFIPFKNVDY